MMPEGEGGVCYREGLVVNENYQICDITNRKILDQLKEKKPQATFSCNADRKECNFQCMFLRTLLALLLLTITSLGRSERILLLRPRYLYLELQSRTQP